MHTAVWTVFGLVYVGMMLGGVPGLAIDRTGVALLGAIALAATGAVPVSRAWASVDMPTLYLLFGLMVLSAQLRLGGFYTALTRRLVAVPLSAPALLAGVIGVAGALSAVLTNDIVCLAMAPVLVEGCARRRLAPVPFLLALACASNVGSAATLIGNPQNILIGQSLGLSFARFLGQAGVPALLGLGITWAVIAWQFRGRLEEARPTAGAQGGSAPSSLGLDAPAFDAWQTGKGLAAAVAVVSLFLFAPAWPHELVALAAAGLLLLSRRMATRAMLGLVDWHLLVLFAGLFVVNGAAQASGASARALAALVEQGVDPRHPGWLFGLSVVLSNVVSNVPATMLLLPSATHPNAGPILALSSTLAGNLVIVGSIANIIVVEQARALGLHIDFGTHARTGVPVTLATLAIAAGWLALGAA